jgi:hypothetical protein
MQLNINSDESCRQAVDQVIKVSSNSSTLQLQAHVAELPPPPPPAVP